MKDKGNSISHISNNNEMTSYIICFASFNPSEAVIAG